MRIEEELSSAGLLGRAAVRGEARSRLLCHLMLGRGGPAASDGVLPALLLPFIACRPQGMLCGALGTLAETGGVAGGEGSTPRSWMDWGGVGYAENP